MRLNSALYLISHHPLTAVCLSATEFLMSGEILTKQIDVLQTETVNAAIGLQCAEPCKFYYGYCQLLNINIYHPHLTPVPPVLTHRPTVFIVLCTPVEC